MTYERSRGARGQESAGADAYARVYDAGRAELALVLNNRMDFTAGNDVSSRDIEGENPLYPPQARVYDGPCRRTASG